MRTHAAFVKKLLKNPTVQAEYDAQAEEFALLDELLKARQQAGLTRAQVAARIGTKTPAVERLEGGGGSRRHSPSVATLRKFARAVGCDLEIRLRPSAKEALKGAVTSTSETEVAIAKLFDSSMPVLVEIRFPAWEPHPIGICARTKTSSRRS